jgi:hypothetical protein
MARVVHSLSNIRISIRNDDAEAKSYLHAVLPGKGEGAGDTQLLWGEYQDKLQNGRKDWRTVHRDVKVFHNMEHGLEARK